MTRIARDHIDLFFDHGIDIGTKTLYLGNGQSGEIDTGLAADTIKGLHILSRIRPDDPVNIIINCSGGDVNYGLAIYDQIRSLSSRVNACVRGNCHSMAAWILQAADYRTISKHSSIMIHNGSLALEGTEHEVRNWVRFHDEQDDKCVQIMLNRIREKHPKYAVSSLKKLLRTDTILWPEEALELGLIDEILE